MKLIGESVNDARDGEDSEVPERHASCRLDGDVEKADEEESWNVLQVVQMVSAYSLNSLVIKCNLLLALIFRIGKSPVSKALDCGEWGEREHLDDDDGSVERVRRKHGIGQRE